MRRRSAARWESSDGETFCEGVEFFGDGLSVLFKRNKGEEGDLLDLLVIVLFFSYTFVKPLLNNKQHQEKEWIEKWG